MVYERGRLDPRADGGGADLIGMLGDIAVAVLLGLLVAGVRAGDDDVDQNGHIALEDRQERLTAQSVHHHANPYDRSFAPYNRQETLLSRPPGSNSK